MLNIPEYTKVFPPNILTDKYLDYTEPYSYPLPPTPTPSHPLPPNPIYSHPLLSTPTHFQPHSHPLLLMFSPLLFMPTPTRVQPLPPISSPHPNTLTQSNPSPTISYLFPVFYVPTSILTSIYFSSVFSFV